MAENLFDSWSKPRPKRRFFRPPHPVLGQSITPRMLAVPPRSEPTAFLRAGSPEKQARTSSNLIWVRGAGGALKQTFASALIYDEGLRWRFLGSRRPKLATLEGDDIRTAAAAGSRDDEIEALFKKIQGLHSQSADGSHDYWSQLGCVCCSLP